MPVLFGAEGYPADLFMVLFFAILGLTGILIAVPTVLAYQWRMRRVAQAHVDLKREMVQRGMTGEEIERVIRATSIPELVQQGLSTKEIERLLRATDLPGSGNGDPVASGRHPAKGAPLDPEF